MPEQHGDKSQEPTQHRRQQAREQGQVAKSQDLGSAVLLLVGVLALMMAGGRLTEFLRQYTASQLGGSTGLALDASSALAQWYALLAAMGRYVLPIFGLLLLGAVVVDLSKIGFLFVPEKVAPDLSHLDPIRGLQRIFSLAGAMRLGFGLFKIAVVAAVAAVAMYQERGKILGLSALSAGEIAAYLIELLLWTSLKIAVALVVLALVDYGFQRWRHEQDLRMTPQEVREEMKNLEGNPLVHARRRHVQRQLVLNRLSSVVPKADVVVTNPTRLAVAIQYDPEKMAAPIVLAKGAGLLAERIRKLAREHGVPVLERKPLAQALYREVEVNHPIPPDRYAAVAELLAYVYQLKGKKDPGRPATAA